MLKKIVCMWNRILIGLFFISHFAVAQVNDSIVFESEEVVLDTIISNSIVVDGFKNEIINAKAIDKFYQKLIQLEENKDCKIRITHIGDSHIQADLFSGKMRALLQEKFGNGGLGFSFPYNLAKTNGNYFIKYTSNAGFESYRNIYPDTTKPVGLSGIALETVAKDFVIQVTARDAEYAFNSVKVITPKNQHLFDLATTSKEISIQSNVPKVISHKIKSGEALSIIADKYNVTIASLKKANGLRSNNIQAGKVLKIPTNEMETKKINRTEFQPIPLYDDVASQNYYAQEAISTIYLVPTENQSSYALNGLVLENNKSGLVYNAIGVNGAKASDYNKFPMFFNQMKALESDLVLISLGTNESFDKKETQVFLADLQQMVQNIKTKNPAVEILLTTPPPSLFNKKYPNTFVADYAQQIIALAETNNVAVWDMFQALGGISSVNKNFSKGLMSRDKVHYSKKGYEWQGELFYEAFMKHYKQFKEKE